MIKYEVFEHHTLESKNLNNLGDEIISYGLFDTIQEGVGVFQRELDFQLYNDGSVWVKHDLPLNKGEIRKIHLNYVGESDLDDDEMFYDLDLDSGYDLILIEREG